MTVIRARISLLRWRTSRACSVMLLAGISSLAGAESVKGEGAVTEVVARPAPLVEAVRARDQAAALRLLQGAKPGIANERAVDGTTALHWAVYNDDAGLVDRLIAAGAD